MIRDWIVGEIVRSGRSRPFLVAVMWTLFVQAGSRTGYLKLAREIAMGTLPIGIPILTPLIVVAVGTFRRRAGR
jgi:hypothetical protein